MRTLRLVGVDDDGTHLVLSSAESGEAELRLPIDERLHAALRGDRARLGQLEIQLDSQLRPRDIQARVRAGESVESVAQAAGVSLDRVMRYAGPVLDEREHVATRARRAALRRHSGDGPAPLLQDAVARRVIEQGHDPDQVVWDAWRRGDGRWAVGAAWKAGTKTRSAHFVFDMAGRSVSPEDDEARAVAGERPPAPVAAAPRAGAAKGARAARLSVVPHDDPVNDDPANGDPAQADAVRADPVTTALAFGHELGDDVRPESTAGLGVQLPVPPLDLADDDPTGPVPLAPPARPEEPRLRLSDIAAHVEESGAADERPDLDEPREDAVDAGLGESAAVGGSRARRATVPSWDEIMFGRRRKGD